MSCLTSSRDRLNGAAATSATRQKRRPRSGEDSSRPNLPLVKPPYQRGDRFRTTRTAVVPALTHWRAPMTDSFEAQLPAGLVVVALKDAHPGWRSYPGLPVVPEEYELWERRLVPTRDLALKGEDRGYDGFHLSFGVTDLGDLLEWLPGNGVLPFEW